MYWTNNSFAYEVYCTWIIHILILLKHLKPCELPRKKKWKFVTIFMVMLYSEISPYSYSIFKLFQFNIWESKHSPGRALTTKWRFVISPLKLWNIFLLLAFTEKINLMTNLASSMKEFQNIVVFHKWPKQGYSLKIFIYLYDSVHKLILRSRSIFLFLEDWIKSRKTG